MQALEETLRDAATEIGQSRRRYRKSRWSWLYVPLLMGGLTLLTFGPFDDSAPMFSGARVRSSTGIIAQSIGIVIATWLAGWYVRDKYRRQVIDFGLLLQRLELNQLAVSAAEHPLGTLSWHIDLADIGSRPDGNLKVLRPLRDGAVAVRSWDMEPRKAWDELLRAAKDARWKPPVPDPSG